MLSLKQRADRVRAIHPLLQRMHGRQVREHTGTGLDMLVEAMLAQNTNLSNALAGYRQLRRAFPTWSKVLRAPIDDVQRHITICGLARMRARRLQALLKRLKDEHGKLEIDFLAEMEVDAAEEYLLSFHGIGPKTAGYTLLFAYGMPIFPVDNGILRVARRLRLVRLIARDAEAGKLLARVTPPKHIYSLHVLMFTHAKKLCRPKNPKCDECLLVPHCPHGQKRLKHRPPDPIVRVQGRPVILSRYASAGIPKRSTREEPHRERARPSRHAANVPAL